MLRTHVLRLIRPNVHTYRAISSTSPWNKIAKDAIKPKYTVDKLFEKERQPVGALIEDPIIAKKFFVSEVDDEQMLYPEVISKDELDKINKLNEYVSEYIEANVQFDCKGISQPINDAFKQMGLYGYNVPREYGGAGYTYTETILASEAEAQNINVAMALNEHRLVCDAINGYGSADQRSKYLPKLAKGDLVATTAFQEWSREDIAANRTTAEYDSNEDKWRLNGTKSFVLNAAKSNLLLVTALLPQSSKLDSMTVFLVDSDLDGISIHKKDMTVAHTESYQSDVSFKDVYLPKDAMLSVTGSGRHIERTLQFLPRIQHSALNLIQMREIAKNMLALVDAVEQQARLSDPEGLTFEASAFRLDVSKHASQTYATESMLYMTVGLMDLYKNTNVDVETAILKTFSQDSLLSMAMNLSSVIDISATVESHPLNHLLRDAIQLQTFGEPKDILKLYIGVAGIQYSGDRIFDDVKKIRNPFFNPEHAIKRFWTEESMDKYESNLQLMHKVVKEFDTHANWLEASIQRLRIGANNLMQYHGRKLLNEHTDIQRLAEAATYIYASFACLVRANRSWILKLPGAEQERILAGCCGDMLSKQVKDLMLATESGTIVVADRNYLLIAKQLLKTKSYFPVHPLTRFL